MDLSRAIFASPSPLTTSRNSGTTGSRPDDVLADPLRIQASDLAHAIQLPDSLKNAPALEILMVRDPNHLF
jgi:hypothetical protein